jgi:hypothetical protein
MVGQVNQFKLVNNDTSKGIKFMFAQGYGDDITVNNIVIPATGQSSDKNFVRNYGGFKRLIRVDFSLYNDGTDKSTDSSNKVSLSAQRKHIMDSAGVIQGNSTGQSSVTYTVTLWEDGAANTYVGGIENVNCSFAGDNAMVLTGSFNLNIGGA